MAIHSQMRSLFARVAVIALFSIAFLPALALAQDNPNTVADNLPKSSAFWTAFLTVVALPFLGKAISFIFDLFLNWRVAKHDKHVAAYQRVWNMAGDAIGYVNAQTATTRTAITAADSPGGSKVTPDEAKRYQDEAKAAIMRWLGSSGIAALSGELGIAASALEDRLKGIIQQRFDAQQLAADAALAPGAPAPIVGTVASP
jgi:hypothetical protein